MPSAFTHAVAAVALGSFLPATAERPRLWLAGALCAALPDLDVLGFALGVRYGDLLGHRGLTHSLLFAAALAALLAFAWPRSQREPVRWGLWSYLFLATASHGLLDMLTDGGLGIALFSPFDSRRYFFPWHPIAVSPIGATRFFSERGLAVLASEVEWVWIPCGVLALIGWAWNRRSRFLAGLALISALALTLACRRGEPPENPIPPLAAPLARPAPPSRVAGQPAFPPDAAKVAAARASMAGGGQEDRCGPYLLWTDVADSRWAAACSRLASGLDALFAERFGVRPVGSPREGILLFRRLSDFRAFVKEEGRLAAGYAGFASPTDGLLVLHADTSRRTGIETLAHELTHLVEHRAFGSSLPPWLSEGMADAVGYTASEEGFHDLSGIDGVEVLARRLRGAQERGEARPLTELAALRRSGFDRGVRSFDYEQSALWVRYLLLDPDLSQRFRSALAGLARGERYDATAFLARLALPAAELEQGFAAWLARERPSR